MSIRLFFIMLFFLSPFMCRAQSIDYNPRSLQKDLQRISGKEAIELSETGIPDSMYNDILLDNGKIYRAVSKNKLLGFAYVGRIFSCRAGGCGAEDSQGTQSADEDYEYFDYYILFNKNLKVEQVRVYNYQATHGHEVGGRGWLKQFIGYAGDTKLELGKNIDSISGATISANAITYNVQEAVGYLNMLLPLLPNIDVR